MTEITIDTRAYAKMMLHAMKYPHCGINGVLVSEPKKDPTKDVNLKIVNCIPLFHHSNFVTPMAEIAMLQLVVSLTIGCRCQYTFDEIDGTVKCTFKAGCIP